MNKAIAGDGIPDELLKVLKMILLKYCDKYVNNFGKLSSGHRAGKGQFSSQFQRKKIQKKYSNYSTIEVISHAGKVLVKILQDRL